MATRKRAKKKTASKRKKNYAKPTLLLSRLRNAENVLISLAGSPEAYRDEARKGEKIAEEWAKKHKMKRV